MQLLKRLLDRLLAPWMHPADQLPDSWRLQADHAAAEERALSGRKLLYGVAATVSALILWSAFAEIDEVTRGQGKVIPSRQVQIIQSQDGGLVSEILVAEGDVVREGQLLVRLDSTRSTSSFRERLREFQALSVKEARLRA
jgi:adhesin transport system membrane fusion protein